MNLPIVTKTGENSGREAVLKDELFAVAPHKHLLYLDITNMRNRKRQGTASTKSRWEIRGSTRKLAAQKGRGKARKGSASAGILRSGATVFGPKPREYGGKMNKKEKRTAHLSALSAKALQKQLLFVEDFQFPKPSTRAYVDLLKKLAIVNEKVLWVVPDQQRNLVLSVRNVPKSKVVGVDQINTHHLLHATKVVILESALPLIEKKFA